MSLLDLDGRCLEQLTDLSVSLVYGFTQAEPRGWDDPTVLALLIGGVLLLGLFVWVEAKSRHALLPLHILVHRAWGAAFVSVCVMFIARFGFYLFVSYYTQTILGYSPVKAGMKLLVNAVSTTVGAMVIAGKLHRRVASNILIAGSLVSSAAGMLILTQLEVDSSQVFLAYLTPSMILTGIGLGCLLAAATHLATVELNPAEAGVASAAYNTVQQVGAAFGTALLNSIATSVSTLYLEDRAHRPEAGNVGTVHGYTVALWVAFGILVGGALVVGLFSRRGQRTTRSEAVLEASK
ncbi:MFS transporter [Streptomyces sp. RS10V-4]|uniref:MFS transporter n=1 Tax=Streptomyces rhizoryzae TaxID=2932493 RepID=UPI002004196B|nr:MFS transporter [Streptomyces rhizoryzae]MCK7628171.1 MFS transporter [Streptomyces rhizoryzae]